MNMSQIVGILNTTPDSYFDGGRYTILYDALRRAGEMVEQGVDIIEVGGESTGPGSKEVSVEEELARTIPIIKALRSAFPDTQLSIDTYKASVASAAVGAGVSMVNDITAGRGDTTLFSVIAKTDAQIVLMYAKDSTPRTTIDTVEYNDVIRTVKDFLVGRVEAAVTAGIDTTRIVVDPGMGHFVSADAAYSFEIIRRLGELCTLAPVFVSPSRKSFLAGQQNLGPDDRLPATIVASVACVNNGAQYIRTHDVQDTRRALEANAAISQCPQ
ncbi:dihydropteroate synthase [Candidatus Peregrinibacteria bacterium]|jgi:dihydropteroate synthase|nr:dihydropteroate synthase [Candidatus Peregrinibacteria bacterium]MBT5468281.1 dihydropteroate synthase [Candidatus Peregrinibacteria bacterium]MBT7337441.1 dihydropteroate synthase [Candidatus Peregrinibacteria bacterium]